MNCRRPYNKPLYPKSELVQTPIYKISRKIKENPRSETPQPPKDIVQQVQEIVDRYILDPEDFEKPLNRILATIFSKKNEEMT